MKRNPFNLCFTLAVLCLFATIRPLAGQTPSSPNSWSIVATYTIPGKASGLAYDGSNIYFGIYGANGSNVYKFIPSSGAYSLQCTGPFGDAFGLTYKSPNLVTISQPSNSSQPSSALEFTLSGTQVSTVTLPDHYMSGIAYDNGTWWVCTYYPDPGKVYHLSATGTILSQFVPPNTQPWDICLQGSDLWIADYYGNMIYKVSQTGTVLESHASNIGKPSGIVYDGTYLWYCAGELGANSTLYKVDLNGSGTPVINVPVLTHNYGTVTTGTQATWNCQVQNTGTAPLTLNSLGVNPGDPISTTMSFPATVAAGGSVTLPIIYSPATPGALNTDAYINSSDPVHPTVTVHLTGNAVTGGPHVNITDTLHNWGERRRNAYSRWSLNVNNNGSGNLVISGLTLSNPAFQLDASVTLPITLIPLQTTKIPIWFHPTTGSDYSGTLSIASNDPLQNPFIVHLEGTGVDTVYPVGTPLWTYICNGGFDNSPKGIRPIQDITGDGIDDVVIASEDNFIRCLNGNSSVTADLMWETEIYSGNVYQENALAIIDDIDNDGYRDVIAGTTGGDRSVRALSGKTGVPLWRYDTHAFGGGGWVYQVDVTYDYNNDGHPDVLACAGDDGNGTGPRAVFCINGLNGQAIWVCPTGGAVFSVIGIEDINGDGKPDVVAGATNTAQTQSRVYGINGANGAILWTNVPLGSSTWALIQVDDFTGDGIKDFASGDYSGNIYLHNAVTGNRDITTMIQNYALILRFQDMGDVNKDGHPDFTIGHSAAKAVMVDGHTGGIIWEKPLSDKCWNVTNLGDITWDGYNDVGAGTLYQDNRSYFLDGADGDIVKMLQGNDPVDGISAIPDIVGDSTRELVVGGRSGGVICLSGGYDTTTTALPGSRGVKANRMSVWPNPCNDRMTVMISLAEPASVDLTLTGIDGRTVFSATRYGLMGNNRWTFGNELPASLTNGVYILTASTAAGTLHTKVIFAKP